MIKKLESLINNNDYYVKTLILNRLFLTLKGLTSLIIALFCNFEKFSVLFGGKKIGRGSQK
ncbi:hypothetical protein LSAJ18_110056 [Latilactobacillus sakei]|nr:hypothetical protein LSAJ18_110056 [Latilactobacillus sakei]